MGLPRLGAVLFCVFCVKVMEVTMRLHYHSEIHLWWVKSLRGEICPWQVKSSLREGDELNYILVSGVPQSVGRGLDPRRQRHQNSTRPRPRYIRNNGGAQGPALQLKSQTVPYLSFNTLGFAPQARPSRPTVYHIFIADILPPIFFSPCHRILTVTIRPHRHHSCFAHFYGAKA